LLVAIIRGYFWGKCPWTCKLAKLLAFSCKGMGRFHGPCEHFTYELPMIPFSFVNSKLGIHSHSNSICTLFLSLLPSLLWDYWFCWSSIPFICRSSVMKSGLICPFTISLKLSIKSGCNNWKKLHLSIHNDVWWLRSCFQTIYII
jgi:hypothetical protein